MQRLFSQRKRNGVSHWMSTVDEQRQSEGETCMILCFRAQQKATGAGDLWVFMLLTAEVKLLVWIVSTVVVSVTFPLRLNTYVVFALKQEGGAVRAIGEAGRWKLLSHCVKLNLWFTHNQHNHNANATSLGKALEKCHSRHDVSSV